MSKANNGSKFELKEPIHYLDEVITSVRVRKPDIHRNEIGCGDIEAEVEYSVLRQIAIEKGLDVIVRKEFEMIELSTFDINAYAYIVSPELQVE